MLPYRPVARDDVPSPCVKVCVMDEASGMCRGCHRTLGEIASWSSMTAAQKRAVLVLVRERAASRAPLPESGS